MADPENTIIEQLIASVLLCPRHKVLLGLDPDVLRCLLFQGLDARNQRFEELTEDFDIFSDGLGLGEVQTCEPVEVAVLIGVHLEVGSDGNTHRGIVVSVDEWEPGCV